MTLGLKFAALGLLTTGLMANAGACRSQTAPAPASAETRPSQLDDVVVVAPDVTRETRAFVETVGATPNRREPAAWRGPICVGVGGMSPEPAQALVDRVSDWGATLGLRIGGPDCTPNIFIVATGDGDATARDVVARRPRDFITGSGGTDRGRAALRDFQTSGRLIRWWHVSLPVSEDTGVPAVRLPGQPPISLPATITRPSDLGSAGLSVTGSRFNSPLRDDLQQVIIVLDSDALAEATFSQIADYISMVALAQIDPEATLEVPSILNLFQPAAAPQDTLTSWDQAYLGALYHAYLGSSHQNSNNARLAEAMARDKARAEAPEQDRTR